ncbi:hypothetical protein Tco_0716602 [Tanacetum coccineum]
MMTYLKHVGNKKHADLKTKSFDEIKALYEKLKRFDDSFIIIGSTEDERKIKEMNEGASDPDKKKKERSLYHMIVKIMERKSFYSSWTGFPSPEGDYLVVTVYSESTPEGIELILWGDLKIMMESLIEVTDQGNFWNDKKDWEIVIGGDIVARRIAKYVKETLRSDQDLSECLNTSSMEFKESTPKKHEVKQVQQSCLGEDCWELYIPDLVPMDDPIITMEEYIRLEEEKAQNHGKISYGKTLSCKPTVSFLNDEIDFKNSFDDSDDEDYTDLENDNEKVNLPSLPPPEPTVSCFDDLDFFKDFEKEFPAIVYNYALTSKSYFLTKRTVSPQHIDEFNLKDET